MLRLLGPSPKRRLLFSHVLVKQPFGAQRELTVLAECEPTPFQSIDTAGGRLGRGPRSLPLPPPPVLFFLCERAVLPCVRLS